MGWVCCGVWKKKLEWSYCSESSLYVCSSGLALQAGYLWCYRKCLVTVEVDRQVFLCVVTKMSSSYWLINVNGEKCFTVAVFCLLLRLAPEGQGTGGVSCLHSLCFAASCTILLQWMLLLLGGFPCLGPAWNLFLLCQGSRVPPWERATQRRAGAFRAFPAAVDLCLEALCECQGKLCFVLASSSHSLGCCGVCPAQGCAWALPGGSREIFQVRWFLRTAEFYWNLTLLWFDDPGFVKYIQEGIWMMLLCH